ncbi:hypothetical protein, partial [Nocardia sp. NPDC058497]|uniref:hypothetical protein n=1 Tax=Nocardia sp. NPDC058497 TaxID=3346529 RepID=UPI00364A68AA
TTTHTPKNPFYFGSGGLVFVYTRQHLESVEVDGLLTGDDYVVLPDGRVPLWVLLTVGDDAHCVTPWQHSCCAAGPIGRDCAMPAGEVIGREFTALGGPDEPLHDSSHAQVGRDTAS